MAEIGKISSSEYAIDRRLSRFTWMPQIPFALIQGAHLPDITAKLHIFELPFYLISSLILISRYIIDGSSASWLLRATIDAYILLHMAYRLLGRVEKLTPTN